MTEQIPKTRLARVLFEQRQRLGSYDRIADQISRACDGEGIDRRKLKKLAEGADVSLKLSELGRIDAYLSRIGEGLAEKPLFEAPGILQALGESGDVALLYGSYPRREEMRTDLIHWDIRSAATLTRDIQRFGKGVNLDMHDIVNLGTEHITGQEPWFDLLKRRRPLCGFHRLPARLSGQRGAVGTECSAGPEAGRQLPMEELTALLLSCGRQAKREVRSAFSILPSAFEAVDADLELGFLGDKKAVGGLLLKDRFLCDRRTAESRTVRKQNGRKQDRQTRGRQGQARQRADRRQHADRRALNLLRHHRRTASAQRSGLAGALRTLGPSHLCLRQTPAFSCWCLCRVRRILGAPSPCDVEPGFG